MPAPQKVDTEDGGSMFLTGVSELLSHCTASVPTKVLFLKNDHFFSSVMNTELSHEVH
jgi:hypothetical protein